MGNNGAMEDLTIKENGVDNDKPEETTDVVARLEEEFKDRYTENDAAHKAVQEMKDPAPPVVEDFGGQKDNRPSSRDENSNKRTLSRSTSPSGPPAKRKGIFGCYSYFGFYY